MSRCSLVQKSPLEPAKRSVVSSRHGGVVADFLNVGIGPVRTGIFSVADAAILAGALVLIAGRLRGRPTGG